MGRGGERASEIATKWATILPWREMGDSLTNSRPRPPRSLLISHDTGIP